MGGRPKAWLPTFAASERGSIPTRRCALACRNSSRTRPHGPPSGFRKIAWPCSLPGRSAFVREGERIVGHGGVSLEEVVVPWIRIERAPAMNRRGQIGFSQRIRLDWLEYTANLVLAGNPREEVIAALSERLKEKLSVGNQPERGNRNKAITILTKIWITVPSELQSLRDEGLDHLRRRGPNDRMLVHWCMCMAVYPFFGTVADAVGRLLRLQGTAGAAQVQRRLRERFGERDTVARAARRILRAYIDWGGLVETDEKGLYRGAAKRVIGDALLAVWAIKAVLFAADDNPRSASALLRGPHLFPFDVVVPSARALETCENLEISRHGLDQEVLIGLSESSAVRE